METSAISYGTYKTLFLRDGISFSGLIDLIREFSTHRPLSSTLAMTWMILSAIFVLIFPTLISALSGYSANGHAYIKDASGNYMDYENLFLIDYVVYNASRLNFTYFDTILNEISAQHANTYAKGGNFLVPPNSTYWTKFSLNDTYIVKRPKGKQGGLL